jgi:uncharacterized cysteine cluster protein YcgN (CxxCxxCC family)
MLRNHRQQHMMQRRATYAAFEKTILDLYDQKCLTLDQLDRIADQYRWHPMDSAGSQYRLTRDGKDLYQVCIELVDPSFPIATRGTSEDHEEAWERELRKWEHIVRWRWGWRTYGVRIPGQFQQDKTA